MSSAARTARRRFDSAAVGTGKTVTVTGLTLSGAAAGNYALASTTATTTAAITAKTLTPSLVAASKPYDGLTGATRHELHAERAWSARMSSAARRHGELRQRGGRHRQDGHGQRARAERRGGRQLRAGVDDGDDDGGHHGEDADPGPGRGEQALRRPDRRHRHRLHAERAWSARMSSAARTARRASTAPRSAPARR